MNARTNTTEQAPVSRLRRRFQRGVASILVVLVALLWTLSGGEETVRSATDRTAAKEVRPPTSTGSPSPPSKPSSSKSKRVLRILDLATGSTAFGVTLRLTHGKRTVFVESDAHGEIHCEQSVRWSIHVEEPPWIRADLRRRDDLSSGVVWVYRSLAVTVRVRPELADSRFNSSRVRFHPFIVDSEDSGPWSGPDWEARWELLRKLPGPSFQTQADGSHVLTVPRVRGLVLGVSHPGWRPTTVRLGPYMSEESALVEVVLQRGYRLRGRLVDSNGNPLARRRLRGFTIVQGNTDAGQFSRMQMLQPEGGFGGVSGPGTQGGYAKYGVVTTTDAEGRFELIVTVPDGETHLYAYLHGKQFLEFDAGRVDRDVEDVEVRTTPVEEDQFVIMKNEGELLRNTPILVSDMDMAGGRAQPAIELRTDFEGRLPANWMVVGRRYSVALAAPPPAPSCHGYLRWNRQVVIDFATDTVSRVHKVLR